MSLIICPECGKEISEYAQFCVNCGCPMSIIKNLIAEVNENDKENIDEPEEIPSDTDTDESLIKMDEEDIIDLSEVERLLAQEGYFFEEIEKEMAVEFGWKSYYETTKFKFSYKDSFKSKQGIRLFFDYDFKKTKFYLLIVFPNGNTYNTKDYSAFKRVYESTGYFFTIREECKKYDKILEVEEKKKKELRKTAEYLKNTIYCCRDLSIEDCEYIVSKLSERTDPVNLTSITGIKRLNDDKSPKFRISVYVTELERKIVAV